jgi:hypothetical protein
MKTKASRKTTTQKKPVINASGKVAGIYQQGSAMGQLALALSDGKPKTEQQLQKIAKGVDVKQRLFWISKHGEEKKLWTLTKRTTKSS